MSGHGTHHTQPHFPEPEFGSLWERRGWIMSYILVVVILAAAAVLTSGIRLVANRMSGHTTRPAVQTAAPKEATPRAQLMPVRKSTMPVDRTSRYSRRTRKTP